MFLFLLNQLINFELQTQYFTPPFIKQTITLSINKIEKTLFINNAYALQEIYSIENSPIFKYSLLKYPYIEKYKQEISMPYYGIGVNNLFSYSEFSNSEQKEDNISPYVYALWGTVIGGVALGGTYFVLDSWQSTNFETPMHYKDMWIAAAGGAGFGYVLCLAGRKLRMW
jgi:hypothetical protein